MLQGNDRARWATSGRDRAGDPRYAGGSRERDASVEGRLLREPTGVADALDRLRHGFSPAEGEPTLAHHPGISPPLVLLLFLLGLPCLHLILPGAIVIRTPWSLLGVLPIVVGVALNVVADRLFTRQGTSVKPHARPGALVTGGPYRRSRNPMYLGFGLIICGVAILLGSVVPLLVSLGFFPLAESLFVRPEEARLRAVFGQEWLAYNARVRRWL